MFTQFTGETGFEAAIVGVDCVKSAQKEIEDAGGTEKIVAFIPLNEDDPAIRAIAAVLNLAVDAHPSALIGKKDVGAEALLLEIFLAGRNSVIQQS
ncbi:MAG: hypothetical protein Q7R79_00550 [bacterium]|nr:hypothetical protein [bacterium]